MTKNEEIILARTIFTMAINGYFPFAPRWGGIEIEWRKPTEDAAASVDRREG